MNRLQKKCFAISLGLHGLLGVVVLLSSAGFRDRPHPSNLQIMQFIPANIVDRALSSGSSPAVAVNQPPSAPALPVPPAPQAQPQRPVIPAPRVERAQPPAPRQPQRIESPVPEPLKTDDRGLEPVPKPRKPHEIHTSYDPASSVTSVKKPDTNQSRQAAARAERQRLNAINQSLNQLANGVKTSGAPSTIVDVSGIGGGEAFASYRDVIFNAYMRAWITPDSITDRKSSADAKITIARDGTILSAETIHPSGDGALDRSVERALRLVTKLPPFPDSARDVERTFTLRFELKDKEMTE